MKREFNIDLFTSRNFFTRATLENALAMEDRFAGIRLLLEETELDFHEIADVMGYSGENSLKVVLSRSGHVPPATYRRSVKPEYREFMAMSLLIYTDQAVAELSGTAGYNTPEAFNYAIKAHHSWEPIAFREDVQQEWAESSHSTPLIAL